MIEQLLDAATRQAEASEPPVRAAALLRIARVLTKVDQAEAERVLDRGLALLAELSEDDRAAMAPQAVSLAACVAPDRGIALRATIADALLADKFLFDMLRHGHAAAAVEYLAQWSGQGEFPYDAAQEALHYAKDEEARRDILSSALRAWHRGGETAWHATQSLVRLFRIHSPVLREDVALDEIRQIVRVVRTGPDGRLNATFGGPRGTVTFSSSRPALLFDLLGPLQRLDSQLAQTVIRENAELARAADIYPFGPDTDIGRKVEPAPPEALEQWMKDWTGFTLGAGFFRIEDEKKSDFRDSFDFARRTYARDADPMRRNAAPVECWPSAEDFRVILYAAGRYEGAGGARLLDRIPDPALRLFAQIEFAAGIAGLDQIGGITREQLPRR
jgi:hypothetical protein